MTNAWMREVRAAVAGLLTMGVFVAAAVGASADAEDPYSVQAREKIAELADRDAAVRARAAEAIGYLRYHPAEPALIAALGDADAAVRRNAAVALGWCGSRQALAPLVARLDDENWTVGQGAWVALTNLTGMEHPYDALAGSAGREPAVRVWRDWIAAVPDGELPPDVAALLVSDGHHAVQRGARAAGALGGAGAVERVIDAIRPWRSMENEESDAAKWRVQAGLRALGRSGAPEALSELVAFLRHPQWSRYAADALGDFGGEEAAAALLDALPLYARPMTVAIHADKTGAHRAPDTHPSDLPRFDSRDRILAAPYAIAFALARIPFRRPDNVERLTRSAPLLAAQVPMDIDGLMVYDEEPFQLVFRHLLERAGARQSVLDAAFTALGQPRGAPVAKRPAPAADAAEFRSPVLRGGDEALTISVAVDGWRDLFLIVDVVEDYSMDRANWAEARLIDAQGVETFLDTLEPVSARQQHDALRINRSAVFDDLRIGASRFRRGLHTHAHSVLHYRLDGRYVRFEARAGVCASRPAGRGSVRFVVARKPGDPETDLNSFLLDASAPWLSNLIAAFCREPEDVPRLVALLDHSNHRVRINAAKTLAIIGAPEAAAAIGERLRAAPPEAAFGFFTETFFSRAQGQDEFNDPAPRYREAFVMALGRLGASAYAPLLREILFDDRSALEIRYRAANALDRIGTPEAVDALREAEQAHPYHSVRMVAREALWRRGVAPLPAAASAPPAPPRVDEREIPVKPTRFVFIKGDPVPYNPFQMDSWRQAYMTTDSGPTYRPGRNLYVLDLAGGSPSVTPLTRFDDGFVADVAVAYDGRSVWFSRRAEDSPWWHLFEIRADGTGLRQVTDGPFHDVQPAVMPNGRIAFSSSRLGMRDEYHGYLCTGLSTMNPDGGDIRVIGFNFGRDAEPVVACDGRLLFTRLELFYSRMKTEFNLLAAHPDGTRMQTLYGPERRQLWSGIHGGYGSWGRTGERHRQLRLVQPQSWRPGEYLLSTPAGPVATRGRDGERFLRQAFLRDGGNDPWVVATPYPLDDDTILVAAGRKNSETLKAEFPTDAVDLGLYLMDAASGELTPLYNDPAAACFEARPLHLRRVPPVLAESADARGSGFSGVLYAGSVFLTQEPRVAERGRLLRVVEALPQVARHMTHTSGPEQAWKNHGGAFGRDLLTVPLASDGSFAVEAPADRLLHLQVLDSDRNVVGNQLVWMHLRPGERKGCVGCHEPPQTAGHAASSEPRNLRLFAAGPLPRALPDGPDQFRYRAKIWFKGHVPDEREERQRTVQAISLLARP